MINAGLLTFVLLLTPLSTSVTKAEENKGCFDFPTMSSVFQVNANESDTVILPFKLKSNDACSGRGEQRSSLYILTPSDKTEQDPVEFCIIRVKNNKECSVPFKKHNCRCPASDDAYFTFTKTVTRDDEGTWTWRLGNKVEEATTVFFNIQYENGVTKTLRTPESSPKQTPPMSTTSDGQKHITFAKQANAPENQGKDDESDETTVSSSDGTNEIENGSTEEEALPSGLAIFAGVFVAANVITIVAVSAIVYVLRGRRERKRRNPDSALPPTPGTRSNAGRKQSRRTEPAVVDASMHSYIELPIRPESRRYEQIPAASIAVGNDGYEIPMFNDPK